VSHLYCLTLSEIILVSYVAIFRRLVWNGHFLIKLEVTEAMPNVLFLMPPKKPDLTSKFLVQYIFVKLQYLACSENSADSIDSDCAQTRSQATCQQKCFTEFNSYSVNVK